MRLRTISAAVLVCLAVLTGACQPSSATPTDRSSDGFLHVSRTYARDASRYVEGSVAFVRVRSEEGVVFDKGFDHPLYPQTLRVPVPPGQYSVHAYQRGCPADACSSLRERSQLDQPSEGCEGDLVVSRGETVTITMTVVRDGCRISTSHEGA